MNKAIIGVIIAIVVIVGGILLFMRDDTETPGENNSATNNQADNNTAMSGPRSLREALDEYKDQQCTFNTVDASGQSQGVVFVGNNQMRGDFINTVSGVNTNSHMIIDDEMVYFWTDGETDGFKMSLSAITDAESNQSVDFDKEQNFDCDDWRIDNDKFDLPSGVTFTDFSAQLQNQTQVDIPGTSGQNPQDDLKTQQCA